MANRLRGSSPHTRSPVRPGRLIIATRRREGRRERLPEWMEAMCPRCHADLGLILPDEAVWCRSCAQWAELGDDFKEAS